MLLRDDVAFKVEVGCSSLSVRLETSIPRLAAFSVKLFSISASVAVASAVVIPKTSWRYSNSSTFGGELVPARSAGDDDNGVSPAIPSRKIAFNNFSVPWVPPLSTTHSRNREYLTASGTKTVEWHVVAAAAAEEWMKRLEW